jgi:hypothetical protein
MGISNVMQRIKTLSDERLSLVQSQKRGERATKREKLWAMYGCEGVAGGSPQVGPNLIPDPRIVERDTVDRLVITLGHSETKEFTEPWTRTRGQPRGRRMETVTVHLASFTGKSASRPRSPKWSRRKYFTRRSTQTRSKKSQELCPVLSL